MTEIKKESVFSEIFLSHIEARNIEAPYSALINAMNDNHLTSKNLIFEDKIVRRKDTMVIDCEEFFETYFENDFEGFLNMMNSASVDFLTAFKKLINLMNEDALIVVDDFVNLDYENEVYEAHISWQMIDEPSRTGRKDVEHFSLLLNENLRRFLYDYVQAIIALNFDSRSLFYYAASAVSE